MIEQLDHPALIAVYVVAALAFAWAAFSILRRTLSDWLRAPSTEFVVDTSELARERVGFMCKVCNAAPATSRIPEIGLSVFERMNPLRALYGGTHLYRRVENPWNPVVVCSTHRDLYASLMDEQLAELRQMAARFSTEVDRRVSHLRSGALLIAVTQEHQDAARQLAKAAVSAASQAHLPLLLGVNSGIPVNPRIVEATPDDVAISAQQTTNGKTTSAVEAN
jgi:hypothetical protein